MTPGGWSRRSALAGLGALAACHPRTVTRGEVLPAGQPAAVLLSTLSLARMIGWPRRPPPEALALIGGADLPQTGALTGAGAPLGLEAAAALRPRLVLDYGDIDPRIEAIAARARRRIGAPYHLIDGALRHIPQAFARAGELIGQQARGSELAERAAAILARWQAAGAKGRSFYYARGGDGMETGFAGALATQVLEGGGWLNVATGAKGIGRVAKEQLAVWDPEVIVTLDARFAHAALGDPVWAQRRSRGRRHILLLPDLPFGWIDRPPSVNRLLGCAWLADGDDGARATAGWLWGITPDRLHNFGARWLT